MQKIFILALCTISTVFAQPISIELGDLPLPNTSHTVSIADTSSQIDLNITGENVNWDFGFLQPVEQRQDSFLTLNELDIIYSFEYPFSNLVKIVAAPDSFLGFGVDNGLQFYRTSPTAFEDQGFIFEVDLLFLPIVLRKQPTDTIYSLPLRYGDMDSTYSEVIASFSVLNLYYLQTQIRKNTVDGWGTLATPYGTHEALRVKSELIRKDSAYLGAISDTSIVINTPYTEYKWLGKNQGISLLEVNEFEVAPSDSLGFTGFVYYKDSARTLSVANEKSIRDIDVKIYPNPSAEAVQLEWDRKIGQEGKLEILDLNGRLLMVKERYRGELPIAIHTLPVGNYVLRLSIGEKSYSGRLQVQKR